VYHEREPGEHEQDVEFIRATVRASRKAEVTAMARTIAEDLMERGEIKAKRATLLRQLGLRFKIPPAIEAKIQATDDSQQLDAWLDGVVKARKLGDIDFKVES
jgi:hypothetical protein